VWAMFLRRRLRLQLRRYRPIRGLVREVVEI
jgi:hypothetical protein